MAKLSRACDGHGDARGGPNKTLFAARPVPLTVASARTYPQPGPIKAKADNRPYALAVSHKMPSRLATPTVK